jgi:cytochrome c oxidase subunit 2
MPTKEVDEVPVLDDKAIQMLADHSCCGTVDQTEVTAVEEPAPEQGSGQGSGHLAGSSAATAYVPPAGAAKGGPRFSFSARLVGFFAVAALVLGAALLLVRPMDTGAQAADYTVEMTMSGFTPPSLDFPAGKAVTLKLVNKESPFHASGAEHQFAVDDLGINEKLDAKQTRVIAIPAQQAGEYTFYCDVCCGGKKSPTMQGTLTFR